jgi:hypothetical protein
MATKTKPAMRWIGGKIPADLYEQFQSAVTDRQTKVRYLLAEAIRLVVAQKSPNGKK